MTFSEYIKNLREKNHLSKRQFAQALDVSPASIVRIENGITVKPSQTVLQKLAHYTKQSEVEVLHDIMIKDSQISLHDAHIYATILSVNGWFVQHLYHYHHISFSCKAIKKREKNHVMLIDQYINDHGDVETYLAKCLLKVSQVVDEPIKEYTLVFDTKDQDVYLTLSQISLNALQYQFHLVLLDSKLMTITQQTTITNK